MRTLNTGKSFTLRAARTCGGRATLMAALGMPVNGIELQAVQVGSATDLGARAGQGAVVVDGATEKKMRQQHHDEKQQRKEAKDKDIADLKVEVERQIRNIVKGFRCPNCKTTYGVQKHFAEHVAECMGGDDGDADGAAAQQPCGGGEGLRDVASATHTAASERLKRGDDYRSDELGCVTVTAQTEGELDAMIATYPLVPANATLIGRGAPDGKWRATFQREPPAYWRGIGCRRRRRRRRHRHRRRRRRRRQPAPMTTLQRVQGGGVGGGIEDATAGGTGLASVSISSGAVRHGRQPQKGQVVCQAGRQRFRGFEVREKHAAAPWGSISCLSTVDTCPSPVARLVGAGVRFVWNCCISMEGVRETWSQ